MTGLLKNICVILGACILLSTGGCVVRELVIKSDPPGATVFINGRDSGKTPLTKQFDFYGSREIVLRMEGRESVRKVVSPGVPWFEFFPLDFFFEIIFPLTLRDRHEYSLSLPPLPERPPHDILERAGKVKAEAVQGKVEENGGNDK